MSSTQMDAVSTRSTGTSSFTSRMQAYPVVAYFMLAFAGTWLLDLPRVLGKEGLGLIPFRVPFVPRLKRWH